MWQDTQPHYNIHLYTQNYKYTVLKYSMIHHYFGNIPHLPHASTLLCLTDYQSVKFLLSNFSLTPNAPMINQGLYNAGQLVLLWEAVFQVPQCTQLLVTSNLERNSRLNS
jgi:hypothetical protein